MAVSLNALTLRINANTEGLAAGVRAVRSDVNKINRLMRTTASDTDKARDATASLNRVRKTGALSSAEYARGLEAIRRRFSQTTDAMREQSSAAQTLWQKVRNLAIAYGGFQAIRGALDTAVAMEQSATKFEVFTGSAQQAVDIMRELKELDRDAPSFGFAELQRATNNMMVYGVAAGKVTSMTRTLSAISAGNAENLFSLSLAFAQVTAKGKLMGEEVRQFVNAGFNPLQQIAEDTGLSMAHLQEEMRKGNITVAMVEQAMKNATSEGGRFAAMNERIAATMGGAFAMLQNSLTMLAADLASVLGPSLAAAARGISKVVESIRAWSQGMTAGQRKMVTFIASFTFFIAIAPRIIAAIRGIVAMVKMWRNAQIALLAFTGPKGWAQLAAGALFAAGTVMAVESAFADQNATLNETANKATAAANAMDEYGMAANRAANAGKPADSSLGSSSTAQEEINRLREQNRLLEFGAAELQRQKMEAEGITTAERFNLEQLRKRNDELKKGKELEAKRKTALENRKSQLQSDADALKKEAERIGEKFKSPFQVLTDELTKLNRMRAEGLINQTDFAKARRDAVGQFSQKAVPIKAELPPSIAKGSRAEYQLLAQSQSRSMADARKRHAEMIAETRASRLANERAANESRRAADELAGIEAAIRELDLGESV